MRQATSTTFFRKKTDGIAGLSYLATEIEDCERTYGLYRKSNEPQAVKIVKDMSFGYLTSYPPPSNTRPDGRVQLRLKKSMNFAFDPLTGARA